MGGPQTVVGDAAPTDPDGDGHFEDLNGNGRLDYEDVQVLSRIWTPTACS